MTLTKLDPKRALQVCNDVTGTCISLYVNIRQGTRDSRIRLKSMMSQARKLIERSYGKRIASTLFDEMSEALAFGFYPRDSGTFAFFHSGEGSFYTRLESHVPDLVVAASTFHVKPLLQEVHTESRMATTPSPHATTIDDLELIAAAAAEGRIDHLWIAKEAQIWGTLDFNRGIIRSVSIEQQDGTDDDLLDDIAQMTLRNGGDVSVVEIGQLPKETLALAAVRWHLPYGAA
jgi:hypothetical protein